MITVLVGAVLFAEVAVVCWEWVGDIDGDISASYP